MPIDQEPILTWWDKFKINMRLVWHKAVFWVITGWGLGKLYWDTALTEADHQAYYDLIPYGLGKAVPFALFALTYFAANGWPQPKLQEKKDEKTAQAITDKLNKE